MKKIVLSAIVLASMFAITSCKKTYSCECVTIQKETGMTDGQFTRTKAISEKMKSKQASAACKQTEEQMTEANAKTNADLSEPSIGYYYTLSTTCDLK